MCNIALLVVSVSNIGEVGELVVSSCLRAKLFEMNAAGNF